MARKRYPVTPAVRVLREHGVAFTQHLYDYEERGGTAVAARELGVDEHATVKTLVMERDDGSPVLVLMHGDLEVSTRSLARQLGARSMAPCTPQTAEKHTGYRVGGTSPLGTRAPLPVCMERTLLQLPVIYVNGGNRGYLVGLDPSDLQRVVQAVPVEVGIPAANRRRS